MDKLFLIDAYALIYRSYYAFINNPRINSKGLNTSAVMGFCNTLNEVLNKEQPSHIGVAFDHGLTFRNEAFPQYKAQREATPEDIKRSVPIIKDILTAYHIPVLQVDGFEADDVIGTLALKAGEQGVDTYMLTPDKDYAQLVRPNVWMYRPRHGGGYETMGPDEVNQKYNITSPLQVIDLLALMGDSADNFPGCPGVGEKTASKLINEFGTVEQLLENTAQLKGKMREKVEGAVEDIKMSKFLATIRTDVPLELDLEQLRLKEPDTTKLQEIFTELEFKSFANRLLNKAEKPKKVDNRQLSLFDEPAMAEVDNSRFEPQSAPVANRQTIETTPHEYHLVQTEADIQALVTLLSAADVISLDTETTSTNAIDAQLVGLSFAVEEKKAYYVPVPEQANEAQNIVDKFKDIYENPNTLKVGQNIKYDLEVLRNYGIMLQGPLFDTMIAHYLLQPELRHNMDFMAEVYLNYETVHIDALIGAKGKMQRLFNEVEMPLIPVLAEMECNGVRIDTAALKETSQVFTERMLQLEQEIYQAAGKTFNVASPKQVGDILFGEMKIIDKPKKTKTGQYVTSEEVLQTLRAKHPIVAHILDYRALKKLLGTYVDALPKLINPRTGHIHTSFNQAVTATGRLSSSDPNLQNIPVRGEDGKEIRKCFIPEEGCEFFSADYSQIELRVMAHLSQDANMLDAFREGYDIHAATAAKIYNKPVSEVTRDERTKAKRANFGIIYGITVFGLADRLNIERAEAKQLIDGYFKMFPQVQQYMEQAKETARANGYVETFFHRRRYLPDINSGNATVRAIAERNAINAPIQGSAADIIKVAMVRIFQRFQRENIRSKMILQVHDELNFSVLPTEKEQVERIVIEEMQAAYPLDVPLVADSGWGNNWLEAH